MKTLNDIFFVKSGNKFDLNKMTQRKESKILFVSRTSKNNGVVAKVEKYMNIDPFPSGCITVALGGSILSSFVQTKPFYTAQNIAVLVPKQELSKEILIYYCCCIQMNKFKYSAFGREANVTLPTLNVPSVEEVSNIVKTFTIADYGNQILHKILTDTDSVPKAGKSKKLVPLSDLFIPVNGISTTNLNVHPQRTSNNYIPFIRPSYTQATSIAGYVDKYLLDTEKVFPSETLYVSTNGQGSHTYSYVSVFEFSANSDVTVLIPKKEMTLVEKLYYAHCITINRYKFSYGRKPKGDKLMSLLVPESIDDECSTLNLNDMINEFISIMN